MGALFCIRVTPVQMPTVLGLQTPSLAALEPTEISKA
jgi:hypothetical protein